MQQQRKVAPGAAAELGGGAASWCTLQSAVGHTAHCTAHCSGVCVQQAGARCTDTQGHRRGFPGHRGDTEAGTGTLPPTLLIEDITDNQESGHYVIRVMSQSGS